MPVDVSSYPTAAPQAQDPLAMIGKVLQIQGAQQALQSQQMEFKARAAMGPILQQSIDPQTGELDINKFLVHGAANPDVAWKMPEITLQMIQRQNMQVDTVKKTLDVNRVKYGAMASALTSVIGQAEEDASKMIDLRNPTQSAKPKVTSAQIASMLAAFTGENGLIDSKDIAPIMDTITKLPNDEARFAYAKRFMNSARDIEKVSADIYGTIAAHGTGGGTSLVQNRPMIGPPKVVGTLENTPTPAEMNAGVPGVTAQGQPTVRPRVEAAPMYGGSGRQIGGSGQGAAPTGLSPQETKLQEERAKSANDYEGELTTANTTGQENLRVLREMQDAMKEFKTGGGMEVRQRLAQMADGLGMPKKLVDDIAGGSRGALAEFQKLAVRYATQEMKTNMGSGQRFTNLDFSTFLKNNPTIDTDPRGLDKMFKFLEQGVWRAGQQQEMHQQWKGGWRPKGFESSGMDSFPAWWTKVLANVNKGGK